MCVRSLVSLRGLGSGIAVSSAMGYRRDSDPAWLWLWRRLAAAAQIGPLAWEPGCATDAALQSKRDSCEFKVNRARVLCASGVFL